MKLRISSAAKLTTVLLASIGLAEAGPLINRQVIGSSSSASPASRSSSTASQTVRPTVLTIFQPVQASAATTTLPTPTAYVPFTGANYITSGPNVTILGFQSQTVTYVFNGTKTATYVVGEADTYASTRLVQDVYAIGGNGPIHLVNDCSINGTIAVCQEAQVSGTGNNATTVPFTTSTVTGSLSPLTVYPVAVATLPVNGTSALFSIFTQIGGSLPPTTSGTVLSAA